MLASGLFVSPICVILSGAVLQSNSAQSKFCIVELLCNETEQNRKARHWGLSPVTCPQDMLLRDCPLCRGAAGSLNGFCHAACIKLLWLSRH